MKVGPLTQPVISLNVLGSTRCAGKQRYCTPMPAQYRASLKLVMLPTATVVFNAMPKYQKEKITLAYD